jgi:heme/copper-type cytochrome/quinol oxidase subunit 3
MTPNARTIDVSALPTIALGPRAPLWWAQALMITIESTIFALLIASYFFVRIGFAHWPLPNEARPNLLYPSVELALLLLSVPPMLYSGKAAERDDRRGTLIGIVLNIACSVAFLLVRWAELVQLDFKWNTDIYGSFVWTTIGLHTIHGVADTVQSCVMLLILLRGKVGEKQILGFQVDGQYWYFVVAAYIPLYFIFYVYPALSKW